MKKYNNYSSVCDKCYARGYHEKKEKCCREYSDKCGECNQSIDGMIKCTGTNKMIDYSELSTKFIPYYENEQRIKVKFSYGEIKTGTVGMTTGWKPVFILMLRSNSRGSSHQLNDEDVIM